MYAQNLSSALTRSRDFTDHDDTCVDDGHGPAIRALLDCRGLRHPVPIDKLAQRARLLPPQASLDVLSDDPAFRRELQAWCRATGATVSCFQSRGNGVLRVRVRLADTNTQARHRRTSYASTCPTRPVPVLPEPTRPEPVVVAASESDCRIIVSNADDDALASALNTATDAATRGMHATVLFTLQSLGVLRRAPRPDTSTAPRSWRRRLRRWFSPEPATRLSLPRPDHLGARSIARLMATAERRGVRFVACRQSMELMGLTALDLEPRANLDYADLAPFLETASQARLSRAF